MAIIKCPECGHQISEKATNCPSCGVEIAGKITRCAVCGEVFFKDDCLCPNCYHPYHSSDMISEEEEKEEQLPPVDEKPSMEDVTDLPEKDAQEEDVPEVSVQEESEMSEATEVEDHPQADGISVGEEPEPSQEDKEEVTQEKHDEVSDTDDEITYIDTDDEGLEKPEHEEVPTDENSGEKHSYIPVIVSLAITALILAVCFYFYNDVKQSRENEAFEMALRSEDVNQINAFLRNFSDASESHRQAAAAAITQLTKEKDDLSLSLVTREKSKLKQYLVDYPETPQKQLILAMIDSIDWEDADKTKTKAAYEKYLADHADGLFAKVAKEKITVKTSTGTSEDGVMAKSLFREFFLAVNGNDASRMTATLNGQISNFLGTEGASANDVTNWMRRQHGDDVSSVIWKLNHDYNITRREEAGHSEYLIDFTAKQTIVKKDGRASSENYKVSSKVTDGKKIASMTMTKYTPQSTPAPATAQSSSSGSTGSSQKNSSSTTPKPAQQAPKQSASGTTPKPAQQAPKQSAPSTTPKPAQQAPKQSASSTTPKPAQQAPKQSASGTTPKPAQQAPKQSASSTTKPSNSGTSSKTTSAPKSNSSSSSSKTASAPKQGTSVNSQKTSKPQ